MPTFALAEIDGEAAQSGRGASAVQVIHDQAGAGALAVVLRAVLILIVVIEPGAACDRENLRDDVEVGGYKRRPLLVTALHVFAECSVGISTQSRMGRKRSGNRTHRRQTVGAAGGILGEDFRAALGNAEIVEVHIVVDVELLPVQTGHSADAPDGIAADSHLVALVLVVDLVAPAAHGR